MPRSIEITGVVRRADGRPVAEAWVVLAENPKDTVWNMMQSRPYRQLAAGRTDGSGAFRISYDRSVSKERAALFLKGEFPEGGRVPPYAISGVDFTGENRFVVPDDFKPSMATPKIQEERK